MNPLLWALGAIGLYVLTRDKADQGDQGDGGSAALPDEDLTRPTSSSLADLSPPMVDPVERLIARLESMGFRPYKYETLRSCARGEYLKEKGVTELGCASLHVASTDGGGGDGEFALAIDIVDGRDDSAGRTIWWGEGYGDEHDGERRDMADAFFAALADLAPGYGLTTGASWGDPAHVEQL